MSKINNNKKNKHNSKTFKNEIDNIQSFLNNIFDYSKEADKFIKIMKDSNLFSSLNITDLQYEKNVFNLWKIYEDNLKCDSSNLNTCTNVDGYHLWPKFVKNDQIIIYKIICQKHQNQLEKNKYIKRYVWKTFDSNLINLFINEQNINKNWDQSRISILDYMTKFHDELLNSNEIKTKGFYLYGSSGVGKTYLCVLLCNTIAKNMTLINKKISICFLNLPDLINKLTEKFSEGISVDIEIKKIINADLLVFDDIGAEIPKEWFFNNHLTRILTLRSEQQKSTIFISNYSLSELKQYYLKSRSAKFDNKTIERVLSRIHNLIGNNIFELKGKDYRKSNQ
ncbi:ATP-binding protein [Mycoplasmoides pirum]|uniref:ATP-binding protein n=1 Tax=Mycoplasmoides pirum TaxID=2122 RepID=UPI000489C791|nr:ATP-binding protein [Mycoplasmoides pirum]